jgi:predicted nucleic acid-binding protein
METERGELIIADAGPLIVLSRIGRLDLMKQVFGGATITQFVRDELLCGGQFPGQSDIELALCDWLKVAVVDMGDWLPSNPDIDPGEASSIFLAEQRPGSLLIIDDRAGRLEAAARGLNFIGLVGVLREARQLGLVHALAPLIGVLQLSGYYLSDAVVRQVLASVGEHT